MKTAESNSAVNRYVREELPCSNQCVTLCVWKLRDSHSQFTHSNGPLDHQLNAWIHLRLKDDIVDLIKSQTTQIMAIPLDNFIT